MIPRLRSDALYNITSSINRVSIARDFTLSLDNTIWTCSDFVDQYMFLLPQFVLFEIGLCICFSLVMDFIHSRFQLISEEEPSADHEFQPNQNFRMSHSRSSMITPSFSAKHKTQRQTLPPKLDRSTHRTCPQIASSFHVLQKPCEFSK
jgi:hypothetical protein